MHLAGVDPMVVGVSLLGWGWDSAIYLYMCNYRFSYILVLGTDTVGQGEGSCTGQDETGHWRG